MNTIADLRTTLERRKGERNRVVSDLARAKKDLTTGEREGEVIGTAQALMQAVAQRTQQRLEYRLGELVTLALDAVFPEPYRFRLRFECKRGRTEATPYFEDAYGNEVDPLNAAGGGCSDVAALALRATVWSLRRPHRRATIVLDEPLKNINDDSRKMHKLAAEMVKELSKTLGLQFIIVTQMPELWEIADKDFHIKKVNGKSVIV